MTRVFIDSLYYIALLNPRDALHRAVMDYAKQAKHPFVTTTAVLIEVADAFCHPSVRGKAWKFINGLEAAQNTHVKIIDRNWFDAGMALFGSRGDKHWSLTDCISFAVMRELGLTDALTADHHFEQAGFNVLLTA